MERGLNDGSTGSTISRSQEIEDLTKTDNSSQNRLSRSLSDSENESADEVKSSTSSTFSDHPATLALSASSDSNNSVMSKSPDEDIHVYANFMKEHDCYSLIPTSSKIVIFDTRLPVKKAFFALVANGLRAAPLWDSDQGQFVGMLTISDFISILQTYYRSPMRRMHELEDHLIETWRKLLLERKLAKPDERPTLSKNIGMVQIGPDASLFEGLEMLVKNKIHRLPIIDPKSGNALYILTHKRILRFLSFCSPDVKMPSFMKQTLEETRIGTFGKIHTIQPSTPVIAALCLFVENRVSALPIVNENGEVIDIYAKFDAINLAATRSYHNLDVTVQDALSHREGRPEGVTTCFLSNTVEEITKKLVKAEVHRLVVINADKQPIGILSLSDLLSKIVLSPEKFN
ncbi:unnamed protein product [Oikopleura dioica]|uniref:CBS domain-containing protein n=1 Tax=Oikopleura dioica TaxID=34765 RepID=E4X330_OIKDI|nr:unnamed protein product [Oikopleura dioica]